MAMPAGGPRTRAPVPSRNALSKLGGDNSAKAGDSYSNRLFFKEVGQRHESALINLGGEKHLWWRQLLASMHANPRGSGDEVEGESKLAKAPAERMRRGKSSADHNLRLAKTSGLASIEYGRRHEEMRVC